VSVLERLWPSTSLFRPDQTRALNQFSQLGSFSRTPSFSMNTQQSVSVSLNQAVAKFREIRQQLPSRYPIRKEALQALDDARVQRGVDKYFNELFQVLEPLERFSRLNWFCMIMLLRVDLRQLEDFRNVDFCTCKQNDVGGETLVERCASCYLHKAIVKLVFHTTHHSEESLKETFGYFYDLSVWSIMRVDLSILPVENIRHLMGKVSNFNLFFLLFLGTSCVRNFVYRLCFPG